MFGMTRSTVFQELHIDLNSPIEDEIGGLYKDIAEDIFARQEAKSPMQKSEIELLLLRMVIDSLRVHILDVSPLAVYILRSATKDMIDEENPLERFFLSHVPAVYPYTLCAKVERVMGVAAQTILDGVVANLSEMGLYHPLRRINL